MINWPTINLDILNFIVGAERGAERAKNRVELSCERELQKNDGAEQSAEHCRRNLRSGNGAERGGYRNRLERGAALLPLTLLSHE